MFSLSAFRRFVLTVFAFLSLLAALPAWSAKLVPEKSSIAVGETLYIRLEADFSMGAQWSASGTGKVDILSSDTKGATVRGVAPGEVTINVKWLTGKKSTRISVTDRGSATRGDLTRALLAPPVQPRGSQLISPVEEIARQKIAAFEATFDPNFARAAGLTPAQVDALRKVRAFEISSDYTARRLLKTSEFSDLGKEYFKTWFDGSDGLIHRIIARAKGKIKMTGYSSDILDLIQVIQNEKSKISMKAPMDFDVGILTKTREEAVRIMKKLGGPAAVSRFHEELEHALRAAYLEIFAELGGTSAISPVRAFISATTAWHPEAYADAKVLKEGGVASRDLVQQTTDVSKYKVREMQRHAREGTLTLEEAMEEAARGTAKDLDKVERVFNHIEKITGVKPTWTAEQEEIIRILKQVEAMEMSASAADAEITRISRGRLNLFDACDQLMDQMEAAWKLRKVRAQELLLSILAEHLDDVDYDKAFKAAVAGKMDELPASAKKIISELDTTAKLRLISMRGGSAQQFLRDMAGDFPNFKIMQKPGDESLQRLVQLIESEAGASADDVAAVFGKEAAEKYKTIHGWLTPPVKQKIVMRYGSNKFAIWELDKKGQVLLGDAGATLKFDAAIGLAMGFWQTASIMDQNLSPEEESRAILNAWGTALPVVGDIAQGLIEGAEGWYGDDRSKLFKAGIWIVIGSAQLVPGAQAAGLAAGLGLMTYEVASSIWDVSKDKALVEAWLASGDWDRNTGTLKALLDAGKTPHELSPEGLFRKGNVGYLSGLEGVTIRDSLYQFAERNGLDQLETLQSYLRALKGLYPDFPFKETLREPLTIGKPLFAARIREGSGMNTNPFRSVEMLMFVKAKQIVDSETARATQRLIEQVEAEYQARRHTGSALAAYRDLEALGQRLGLPLVKHVKETFMSFSGFVTEAIKTPWVRESLPRREVMLVEKYLAGYLGIEQSLKRIQSIFQQAGIHAPSHNLSGWLEIDAPRIKDLEAAYANRAVGDVAREVQRIHREASGDDTYVFKAAQPDPCDAELFRTLSGIMVRIIDAEDRLLLLQQWSGKKSAAETSRDEKLRTAQKATEDMKKSVEIWIPGYSDMFGPWKSTVGALPGQLWDGLATSYEEAYAWAHLTWEGSQVYGSEAVGVAERIERLKDDYTRAVEDGTQKMGDCVRKTLKCALKLSDPTPKKGARITATATVSPTEAPRNATWSWSGSGGVAVASSAGNQATLVANGQGTVALTIEDSKRARLAECAASVTPDDTKDTASPTPPAPNFSATLPGNWEMQPIKDGVKFVRKEAKTKGPCGWDSSVTATVTAVFKAGAMDDKALQARIAETQASLEKQRTERKIGCAAPDMAVGLFKAGGLEGVASLALGEFKGGIVDYPNWVRRGSGGWMSGYTGSGMIACGNGAAHGKAGSIEFSYSAGGGGCWDNSDRAYLVRQVLAAQKEARAIIASLRLDGAGIRSEPYKGPKYDGSDNPAVKLLPEKLPKLKVGDLATVEAVVENADPEDPPYTYDWDGNFHGNAEDLKKGAKVTLHPDKPGKYRVGVAVSGQRYGMGYANLEYEVADVQVKVERVPNENTPVPVGGRARFKATLLVDGKPAEGAYLYRWQPNTELVFSATESAAAAETTASFTRLDERQKLWVEVLERKEGRLATVAESERLEIRVIQPKLSLSAEPKEPMVGQETRVTLKDEPRLDDKVAGFRWEHKGEALNAGAGRDERVFTFKPKNLKPVTVTARGYLRDGNVGLGEAELAIQPKAYDVKLNPPRARGPQLQVWVCDTQLGQAQKCGMKDIPQGQFATFQDIFIQSAVTPQPPAPRYRWSVDPSGSCGLPGAGSELRLNCSSTGSYTVKLQVTDADNVLLGEAKTSVNVTASDADVKQAPKSKEAYEKMQQAKQKANDGLLDEAITLAGAASSLDPKNTEARDLGNRWSTERNTVRQQLDRARNALAANKPDEAQRELDAAKKLHPKYPALVEVEKQINDKRKAAGVTTTAAGATSQPISLAGVGGKQGTPRVVKDVVIDDSSWIRFKSTDENRRSLDIPVPTPTRAEAVAIVSNLDDATYLEQGKTIARIVIGKDSGDEVLEIQAGVHSSEWNYGVGPKHKRVDSADIGDNRFLVVLPFARAGVVNRVRVEYVDTNAPKWAGHAPGFVLRGISLVTDKRGLTPSGSPSGSPGHTTAGSATVTVPTVTLPMGAKTVLDDDLGPYEWIDRSEVQSSNVRSGRAAFRSTGNNHFTHRLGMVGNYPGQYRYLDLWLWFDKPGADIQLQVQIDGTWGKRWGFEAGQTYDGYGWAMEGTTANQPVGRWVNVRLDLIDQLKIHAGQAITGLAFSSDGGDVFYDAVSLQPSANPLPMPVVRPQGKIILEDDLGPYQWVEASPVQKDVVASGRAAFRTTGNNHFAQADLGIVGDYPDQVRTLSFWAFFIGPDADIQLQVQVDGAWGKRWGYEAGPKYDGYGWPMEGTTANVRPGVWQEIKIDLVRDLKIKPGQRITGLAFSSDGGDVFYDAVSIQPNPDPARKPSFQPAGKMILEDDLGPYSWVDRSEAQDWLVFRGNKAFRATGNNHFTADLGVAGDGAGQFRTIGFWAFFMGPDADIQLQVQVNGTWGKRWGFDAGPAYNGYDWTMEGTTSKLPVGRWTWIQLDLINQLGLKTGDRITGLAFSSNDADVVYDSVWLIPSGSRVGVGGDTQAGGSHPPAPAVQPPTGRNPTPGGRDYTGVTPVHGSPSQGYLRIEACVDGSDWIRIDNGRLTHEHRAFDQIGAHPSCPASHRLAGGGFLVDGQAVGLHQLPRLVGIAGIGRIEVERGRGAVRLDGPNRILIDDDGPGGADVYIIRVYPGAGSSTVGDGVPGGLVNVPGGRDYTGPVIGGAPGEFANPQVDGVALDICREWGANCGKPAADAFCQRQGYAESIDHRIQYDTPPTRIISSGQVCDGSYCDRIVWVKCGGGTPGVTSPAGQLIFEVGNIGGVANGPSRPTTFTLAKAHRLTLIRTYHWNSARGAKPGTIALRDASGRVWGPWPTTGSPGQGGVPNAYWTATPNVVLPAGSYTVVDSDPASWAHNAESGNRGFVRVEGYPTDAAATPPGSAASKPEGVVKEVDELLDAIKSLKGLFGK